MTILLVVLSMAMAASEEKCVINAPMPGATYSDKDKAKEQELCAINFRDDQVALCPKTWSTSAATSIYGIKDVGQSQSTFESNCKGKAVPKGTKKLGKFKQNMNIENSSAVWIKGIQTYYHLSRYLDTQIVIPPVVYREINVHEHLTRVSQFGAAHSLSAMNRAAWNWIVSAEKNPSAVASSNGFFTADLKNTRGVIYKDSSDRYGYEMIGSDDWGQAGSNAYLQTAPYRALRVDANLASSVQQGLAGANRTGKNSTLQVVSWMRDLTEVAVLDYILSQQDRFGNLDYSKKYVYVESGEVKTRDFEDGVKGIEAFKPQVLQVTHMSDNDASVRPDYTNFAKKHGYLAGLRHFSGKIYARLHDLSADFKAGRSVAGYLKSELGLNDKEIAKIETQLGEVMDLLKDQCTHGKLRFDLDEPKQLLIQGTAKELLMDCNSPRI